MKRQIRIFLATALLCLALCSCGGEEILEEMSGSYTTASAEKPRESSGTNSSAAESSKAEEDSLEEETDPEEEEPAYSFLMDEASVYAYNSLTEMEQIWYRDIEEILGTFGLEKKISKACLENGMDEKDIDRIFQCVLSDHPELFYVDGYSYTKYTRGEKITSIEFSGSYTIDFDTAVERRVQIEAAAAEIIAGINKEASDYEKVKYVYETLIQNTDYQLDSPDNQNIYSVFINHVSVCQGYAKATQYLLDKLGIECSLVLGTVDTGEGHAWNLVKVDGSYYYVDTTWGDASYQISGGEDLSGYAPPEINYDYLCVTTSELLRTHTLSGQIPMPQCVSDENNYYVREGAMFMEYDKDQMSELFKRALDQGKADITVKCMDDVCYQDIVFALIDRQEIFEYLPGRGGSVAYSQNDKQLSLTFWVTNEQ